jgi:outer membrane protein OmpA-like peptidoglycan-associated protein
LNSQFHNASVNISPNGNEVFIYNDENGGDIYASFKGRDGVWSSPKGLEGINTEYLENSATITKDGKRIYFTSNRLGSYGGTDVYTAVKNKNDRWTDIQNLGPIVNTEHDEEDVFISANGIHLYFSSNGHAGMGDLDIYRSSYDSVANKWSEPVNLGYPINSVENDIYFVLTGDETHAYFSSVKADNKGEQDIYEIDMTKWKPVDLTNYDFISNSVAKEEKEEMERAKEQEREKAPSSVSLEVVVLDEATSESLDANVSLVTQHKQVITAIGRGKGSYRFEWTNASGQNARYELSIDREGYVPHVSPMYFYLLDRGIGKQVIRDTIRIKRFTPPKTELMTAVIKSRPEIIQVFFDNDSAVPKSFDGIKNVEKMMKVNPEMKVEIEGHTDDQGSSEYNLSLSCRRAEAVRAFLIRAGISAERIAAAGFGEYRPLTDNKTYEGRKLNRRTEFTIIEQ